MTRIAFIVAMIALSSNSDLTVPPASHPTLASATMTFDTTVDDKDYDTQVRDHIECDGKTVATLECCSADHQKDHWVRNTSESRDMTVLSKSVKRDQLDQCKLVIGIVANGDDNWVFPKLRVTFVGGKTENWTFKETTLHSLHSNEVTTTYFLSK
jgi:hypothetical protein